LDRAVADSRYQQDHILGGDSDGDSAPQDEPSHVGHSDAVSETIMNTATDIGDAMVAIIGWKFSEVVGMMMMTTLMVCTVTVWSQ
ncbi:unnamed protein product, partial [Calicophoron daubneyi]